MASKFKINRTKPIYIYIYRERERERKRSFNYSAYQLILKDKRTRKDNQDQIIRA